VTKSLYNVAKIEKNSEDQAPAMKTPKRQPAKKTDWATLSKLPKKETLLSGLFL
jgi:hypothetical protein